MFFKIEDILVTFFYFLKIKLKLVSYVVITRLFTTTDGNFLCIHYVYLDKIDKMQNCFKVIYKISVSESVREVVVKVAITGLYYIKQYSCTHLNKQPCTLLVITQFCYITNLYFNYEGQNQRDANNKSCFPEN